MSIVVLSISHRSAPFEVLESVTLSACEASDLARVATELEDVRECLVLATCNRVEIYLATESIAETTAALLDLLAERCHIAAETLRAYTEISLDDSAISHIFRVAGGLESMVLGEGQVLGQLRDALTRSQLDETIGPEVNAIVQQALRAGKRAHAETGIDRFAPSVVTAAFDQAGTYVNAPGARFLVAGAGTMSVLAVLTLIDRGVPRESISVSNRALGRALDLSEKHGISAVRWEALDEALTGCDVLITCTGATDVIFDVERLRRAVDEHRKAGRELAILDLALPRDVGPGVRDLPGVALIDLETLTDVGGNEQRNEALAQVQAIVDWEIAGQLAARRQALVMPTVMALRDKARDIVDVELARVQSRLGGLDEAARLEVQMALQRVAQKIIHTPTVRLKALAETHNSDAHTDVLNTLFELEPGVRDEQLSVRDEQLSAVGER